MDILIYGMIKLIKVIHQTSVYICWYLFFHFEIYVAVWGSIFASMSPKHTTPTYNPNPHHHHHHPQMVHPGLQYTRRSHTDRRRQWHYPETKTSDPLIIHFLIMYLSALKVLMPGVARVFSISGLTDELVCFIAVNVQEAGIEDRYTHILLCRSNNCICRCSGNDQNQVTAGGEIMAEIFNLCLQLLSGNGSCWRQAIYQCYLHYFFQWLLRWVFEMK